MMRVAMCSSVLLGMAQAVPSVASGAAPHSLVWPPPKSMTANGPPLPVAREFAITSTHQGSAILDAAIARFTSLAAKTAMAGSDAGLHELKVTVANADERLSMATDYSYSLTISEDGTAVASAESIFGAMYALESFTQLLDEETGTVLHSSVSITDEPEYTWRGLMIDSGRRFFPVPLVKNLMDTMAANKMNVLHLHASDHCRFGVESKNYPKLHTALTGIHKGYYTQEDVKDMIAYGKKNGIRVVPEFDIPGHSRGFLPLECSSDDTDDSDCLVFCTALPDKSQLYGDPDGKTFGVLHKLFAEMAGLFDDEVFNIGADETSAKGPCSVNSTFAIERKVVEAISTEYKKTPEGWEELFFDAGAATPDTIVNAWARHSAGEITKTGRKAVESASDHFYFTSPGPAGPAGWSRCHYAIDTGVPDDEKHLLLGGEMSMWSDTYCDIDQCGSSPGPPPVAHALYPPSADKEFGESIGGMIWPRGYVGAASFWNFDNSTDVTSAAYQASIYKMNDMLAKRGSLVCPSQDSSGAPCKCDQLTACGKPYLSGDTTARAVEV